MKIEDLEKSIKAKEKRKSVISNQVSAEENAIKGLVTKKYKTNSKNNKTKWVSFRVTETAYNQIEEKRKEQDFRSVTEYVENLLRKEGIKLYK